MPGEVLLLLPLSPVLITSAGPVACAVYGREPRPPLVVTLGNEMVGPAGSFQEEMKASMFWVQLATQNQRIASSHRDCAFGICILNRKQIVEACSLAHLSTNYT